MTVAKLRFIFILSVVILAGVFIATFSLIPASNTSKESKRIQIIEGENEWILQYDIFNNEERDIAYTILITANGDTYSDSTVVESGGKYTYIQHLSRQQLGDGAVTLAVYEDGRQEPIEEASYQVVLN